MTRGRRRCGRGRPAAGPSPAPAATGAGLLRPAPPRRPARASSSGNGSRASVGSRSAARPRRPVARPAPACAHARRSAARRSASSIAAHALVARLDAREPPSIGTAPTARRQAGASADGSAIGGRRGSVAGSQSSTRRPPWRRPAAAVGGVGAVAAGSPSARSPRSKSRHTSAHDRRGRPAAGRRRTPLTSALSQMTLIVRGIPRERSWIASTASRVNTCAPVAAGDPDAAGDVGRRLLQRRAAAARSAAPPAASAGAATGSFSRSASSGWPARTIEQQLVGRRSRCWRAAGSPRAARRQALRLVDDQHGRPPAARRCREQLFELDQQRRLRRARLGAQPERGGEQLDELGARQRRVVQVHARARARGWRLRAPPGSASSCRCRPRRRAA